MRRVGKRGREWARVWAFLKPRLEAAGRTFCEFGFVQHDCWWELFPCHSKKRRECSKDDLYVVAIGCQRIARTLDEEMSHAEMEATVLRAINNHGGVIRP